MQLTVSGKIFIGIGVIIVIAAIVYAVLTFVPARNSENIPDPVWNDAHSLYILDPGPFIQVIPENPSPREFLILQHGDVEISCGTYQGAFFNEESGETSLSKFASNTIMNANWLAGCRRYQLDAIEATIGTREYYLVTLLIRRDHNATADLDFITRTVHKREIERFPDDEDRIVRLYYTHSTRPDNPAQGDIYIFTLSGPPENLAVTERSIRKLFASVYLNASDATLAQDLLD